MVAEFTISIPFLTNIPEEDKSGSLYQEAMDHLSGEMSEGGGINSFDIFHIEEMTAIHDVDEKWHDSLVWGDDKERSLKKLFQELHGKEE